MAFRGDLTSDQIDRIARASGVDVARMRRAMDDEALNAHLQDIQGLAVDTGVTGTPGFMINGELIQGFNRDALNARLRDLSAAR
jgi:2-hydroxychromene-2-carboxylate isomerase